MLIIVLDFCFITPVVAVQGNEVERHRPYLWIMALTRPVQAPISFAGGRIEKNEFTRQAPNQYKTARILGHYIPELVDRALVEESMVRFIGTNSTGPERYRQDAYLNPTGADSDETATREYR